ncbi:hypothetical protein D9613_000428 [Agrocybe pediades]|uniref:F-box domain-containing protein n=1 Tax=Agrocybe pediades TaxID=84607 RepID=A0A8H4VV26_9AGAR|nr:hypothetical protein D9613_000428 [Agrocybe pediades]
MNPGRDASNIKDAFRAGSSSMQRAATSPITTLPVEILQEVFELCAPSYSRHPELIYHSIYMYGSVSQVPPLLLCQVCSLWRCCALSLPRLWTSLDVYVSMGKARPPLSLAALWLVRSGALPLTLSLHQQNESNDNRIAAGEILDLYKLYIHRWQKVHFDLTGPRYCRLLSSQQRSAPLLTHFRMYEQEEKDIFGIFAHVPSLTHLHVSRIPDLNLQGHGSVAIPWMQLVSLSLEYIPSVGTALRILEKCVKLEECSIKVDVVSGPLPPHPVCHNLASLDLNIGNEQSATFFANAKFPRLTRFAIYVRGPLDQYGWPQRSFASFLERSACRLLHFEIHDTGMRFDEFVECLKIPYLQSLENIIVEDRRDWTWDPFVTDAALDLLTCPAFSRKSLEGAETDHGSADASGEQRSHTCHLPCLEAFTFRGSCLWAVDGAVADMVDSRWRFGCNGVRRLKRVKLDLLSSHVEDLRRLKEFSSEGLELDLLFR